MLRLFLYTYINEGNMTCSLGVSNFYVLGGVLLMTLLMRRVFCGYMCPVGALSEWIQAGARKLGIKPVKVPAVLDCVLSLLKYGVLAIILYLTWTASELIFRGFDPCYALISRHGEDITMWSYIVAGGVVVISLFITVPFCRWLCPLAAVLNPFARLGLVRVSRDAESCVDCGKCAKRCPMAIPVDERLQVKEARCTLCLDCVDACPERKSGALVFGAFPGAGGAAAGTVRRGWSQAAVIFLMLTCLTAAVGASYSFPLPSFVHVQGETPAETEVLDVNMENLGCRGNASLLVYFLERDDELELYGYFKLEAWPGPGLARARIVYDPSKIDEEMIKMAITEPYFDYNLDMWRESPFVIEGYDPLGF